MTSIPSDIPDSIIIGDTLKFTKSLGEYLPVDSWILTYALIKTGEQIEFTATDNGDGTHLVNVSAATTAAWSSGEYRYQGRVSKAGEVYTVISGRFLITADYSAASSGLDDREHVKKVLDALQAVIEGKAELDQSSYQISIGGGSRSMARLSWAELLEAEKHYRKRYTSLVNADRKAQGKKSTRQIRARFTR